MNFVPLLCVLCKTLIYVKLSVKRRTHELFENIDLIQKNTDKLYKAIYDLVVVFPFIQL